MGKQRSLDTFKDQFDALAINGVIGDPNGKPGYLYIRVSSEEQAEEGHSGLPRQITHCHEIALQKGYKIPWELVFGDDHSGFEFEGRPELTRLRQEYKSAHSRAHVVFFEHLDRLSRNADWHQGYLLDEMAKHGIEAVFWKPFTSRIERAVMGAVAHDSMELAKGRMKEGTVKKAQSGRITCKARALGYVFVNSKGQPLATPGRDTYYAISDEAWLIRLIFEKAVLGFTLRYITTLLQSVCPEVKGPNGWHQTAVRYIIANPLYKGQYVANRWEHVRTPKYARDGTLIGFSEKMVERDEGDWIIVPVPPIISEELWDRANAMLQKNRERARRNSREHYILTGTLVCRECGRKWTGVCEPNFYYRCPARYGPPKHLRRCTSPQISAKILHATIWRALCQILLDPTLILQAMDDLVSGESNTSLREQIEFLRASISARKTEDERITKGFLAGVFDETEAAQERQRLRKSIQGLEGELAELNARELTPEETEAKKALVLVAAESARNSGAFMDAPPNFQRSIIKLLVDRIIVDSHAQTLRIEGVIPLSLNYGSAGENIKTNPEISTGHNSIASDIVSGLGDSID